MPRTELAFVSGGRVIATARASDGEIDLAAGHEVSALGLARGGTDAGDPLAGIEQRLAVVRPVARLLLFDAALTDEELAAVRAATAAAGAPEPVAVRVTPSPRFELVRARLRSAGLSPPRVLDATTVLAEGEPLDVPDEADAVRLARVAARLRGTGFEIAAIVHRGRHPPATVGFPALRAGELSGAALASTPAAPAPPRESSLAARLLATTGAPPIAGVRVEIELDNARARAFLLDAIEGSRRTLHLQTYMIADDELAHRVERALAEAGARGVAVRVLVDSLHALHGSLGTTNPVLARLSATPGVEVRVLRPVTGVPSIEDLKQRDHRKLVVSDGRLALLGGRNVAHEYYTGFAEEAVTARTPWRRVPWLDAGARLEGPAVAVLERAFLDAWTGAGGAPFPVVDPAPAGDVTARVVVHHGLRDAFSLETYLGLVDTARSHIYVLVGFPLQLEIQHALLRALRRGVRVRALVGAVLPTHGGNRPFAGPLTAARHLATQFVHSRVDALVDAGAECYELAVRDVPGWDPALGTVRPHLHAKVMTADGAAGAVGSANLDITAGYWESELMLLVEDAGVVGALEATLDSLLAASIRIDREDPAWQRLAARRAWWRHWPGMLG
jgi:phosphatidylserine/phosphatidylglycerophosphate/cardiolipin synthase-like enzyme